MKGSARDTTRIFASSRGWSARLQRQDLPGQKMVGTDSFAEDLEDPVVAVNDSDHGRIEDRFASEIREAVFRSVVENPFYRGDDPVIK